MSQNDQDLKDFLKRNESDIPKANDFEFARIQNRIKSEDKSKSWASVLVWGPATMTLALGLIFVLTLKKSAQVSDQDDLIATEEYLLDTYAVLDEFDNDLTEDIF